jgi:hypothetical protein
MLTILSPDQHSSFPVAILNNAVNGDHDHPQLSRLDNVGSSLLRKPLAYCLVEAERM